MRFQECDTCRAKPGSPYLCEGCLNNRTLIDRFQQNPIELFCDKLDEWAGCIALSSGRILSSDDFSKSWRTVRLAIDKSCLLSRTLYGKENPSQTPCPVHKGIWSGCHFGNIPQDWIDDGCRCYQHTCGCTTGWNPDEHCGCVK